MTDSPVFPRAVIFDLDGTLAESKRALTENMGAILKHLAERSFVVVMSGGGMPQFERQFLVSLPADFPWEKLLIFPLSAAQAWTKTHGKWQKVYDHSFSDEEKKLVRESIEEAMKKTDFPKTENPWGEIIEDRGAQISVSALGQRAPNPEKEEWKAHHDESRKQLTSLLVDVLSDFSVKMGGLTTIDITHKGIDKAYGLERLTHMTGIPIHEMLYVGDALYEGGNDAVVKKTGIKTRQVKDPAETEKVIEELLSA